MATWLTLASLAGMVVATAQPAEATTPADRVPPATIRVCRDTYGGGAVEDVPFEAYVKTVLPYEYDSSLGAAYREYFRAGAVAVKSYAWHAVQRGLQAGGGRCHVYDDGRSQHYVPGNGRRTAVTDAAVDDTWHLRLEEAGQPAFAQYCSRSCGSFPPGRHLDQYEAQYQARNGWTAAQILGYAYREMTDYRLFSWRDGLGVQVLGARPVAIESDRAPVVRARLAGVGPGDARATASAFVLCTLDGQGGGHLLQTVPPTDEDAGAAVAVFDGLDAIRGCEQDQVTLVVILDVNGYDAADAWVEAWRRWVSAESRDVTRVADLGDPVAASVAISQELFADRADSSDSGGGGGSLLGSGGGTGDGGATDDRAQAHAVVLARSDKFADSMAATALAGASSPLLVNPGGPDSQLADAVRTEIDRVLDPGDTVHLVGGPLALSDAVEQELQDAGYDVERHGGEDRIETSLLVADAAIADGGDPSTVLVARGVPDSPQGWADAAAAGAYAAVTRHPIVLTSDQRLSDRTERWLERSDLAVDEIVILGGHAAVPGDAEQRLDRPTTRIAGATRGLTAVAIADQLWAREDAPPVAGAMLIDGYGAGGWPFALAGAVYAANAGTPQLLSTYLVPNRSSGEWLDAHGGLPVVIVGGDAVLPEQVERDAAGG